MPNGPLREPVSKLDDVLPPVHGRLATCTIKFGRHRYEVDALGAAARRRSCRDDRRRPSHACNEGPTLTVRRHGDKCECSQEFRR